MIGISSGDSVVYALSMLSVYPEDAIYAIMKDIRKQPWDLWSTYHTWCFVDVHCLWEWDIIDMNMCAFLSVDVQGGYLIQLTYKAGLFLQQYLVIFLYWIIILMSFGLGKKKEPAEHQIEAGEPEIDRDEQLLRELGYKQVFHIID